MSFLTFGKLALRASELDELSWTIKKVLLFMIIYYLSKFSFNIIYSNCFGLDPL